MNIELQAALDKDERKKLAQNKYSKKYYDKKKESILKKRDAARQLERELLKKARQAKQLLIEPVAEESSDEEEEEGDEIVANRAFLKQKDYTQAECIALLKHQKLPTATFGTYKSGVNRFFDADKLSSCSGDSIVTCLKNYETICETIMAGKYGKNKSRTYNISTIQATFQLVLYLMDNFLKHCFSKKEFDKIHDYISKYHDRSVSEKNDYHDNKKQTQVVPTFKTYLKESKEKYGEKSEQYLIALLYSVFTVRDNYNMIIVDDINKTHGTKAIEEKNYIFIPRDENKNIQLVVNRFKTDNKFNSLTFVLDNDETVHLKIAELIHWHIQKKKKKYGDYLFAQSLSSKISTTNQELGYPIGSGGVNFYRHMRASEHYGKSFDYDKREKLAQQMGHSIHTQKKYERQLIITPSINQKK